MQLTKISCPECNSENLSIHTTYFVLADAAPRHIYRCENCGNFFSETQNTPLAGLRTPLSHISLVLDALNEGLGINAASRTFKVAKNSIYLWLKRLADVRDSLMLYSLCHQFLQQLIEGDELYTKIGKNIPPAESAGWTLVLMDRASRFIWELQCGEKDRSFFETAMETLSLVIEQTRDLSLLTDGERRYGNLLFEICQQALRTGKPGRPKHVLPSGVKVRVKNKGAQTHQKGPKRPKYQAPHNEHPETAQDLANHEIHANHVEAFNSALRRRMSCYRRKTNTYAKHQCALQTRLDVYWILHNFIRPHFTTKQVPAVAIGIIDQAFSWADIFRMQRIAS